MKKPVIVIQSGSVFITATILLSLFARCSRDNPPPTLLNISNNQPTDSTIDTTLLYTADLIYEGAFKVPATGFGTTEEQSVGFSYGGTALAYNPAHHSLFLVGHAWHQLTGEISIPAIIKTSDPQALNRAVLLQSLTDMTEGRMNRVGNNGASMDGCSIGGMLVVGDKLLGTSYVYYDAGGDARLSHFICTTDLTRQGDMNGLYTVGTQGAGFVAGYLCFIPKAWQSHFGGDALTGQACLPIISRTSYGPTVTSFNLNDIGRKVPAPGTMLVGYPAAHPTLGEWGNSSTANPAFNMATSVDGVVFPENCGSVLFFGSTGTGIPLYGEGTADSTLHGTDVPGTNGQVQYAYDPADGSKGCHAFPYVSYVWAYRAMDLTAVARGERQPWEITPYATWELELPFADKNGSHRIGGAAYDPQSNTVFISQMHADGDRPVIQVLRVGR